MIYFNENKEAFAFEIEHYIATCSDDVWKEYARTDKWDIVNGEFVDITNTEEYKAKQEAKKQQEIAMLSLTGADVERGIYQAKGIDFDDIVALVTQLQPVGLDIKALKIELKANNFYRGNPYVDAVGTLLGFTKEQLDEFFKTGDYLKLCTSKTAVVNDKTMTT